MNFNLSFTRSAVKKISLFALFLFALALPFSIAIATAFLICFLVFGFFYKFQESPKSWGHLTSPEKILLAYLCWAGVASLFSGDIFSNLLDLRGRYPILLLFLIPRVLKSGDWIHRVLRAFVASASISGLVGVYQFAFTQVLSVGRPSGTRSNPLTYSEGLLLALAVVLPQISRSFSLRSLWQAFSASALVAGIVVSLCRGPWVALTFLLATFEWIKRRSVWITAALLLILSLASSGDRSSYLADRFSSIASIKNNSNRDRLRIWRVGMEMARQRPIFGFGSKSLAKKFESTQTSLGVSGRAYGEMHNVFLQALVSYGLPGLILLGAFFWQIGKFCLLLSPDPLGQGAFLAVIAFLFCGFTESVFNDSEITMSLFLILGCASAQGRLCNQWKEGLRSAPVSAVGPLGAM